MNALDVGSVRFRTVDLPQVIHDVWGLSKSEARRLIDQGAVSISGEKVPKKWYTCAMMDVDGKVLKVGKRRFVRLVVDGATQT